MPVETTILRKGVIGMLLGGDREGLWRTGISPVAVVILTETKATFLWLVVTATVPSDITPWESSSLLPIVSSGVIVFVLPGFPLLTRRFGSGISSAKCELIDHPQRYCSRPLRVV